MNCDKIESILNELKADSLGRIRNKNKVMNKIHSEHLRSLDETLTDIRIFVARIEPSNSTKGVLAMIDEFIYKKQTE